MSRARLLLVEDNDIMVDLLAPFLEGEGFAVDVADNGGLALQKIAETDYDIIIMDLVIKGVANGIDIARFVRSLPSDKGTVPIIALTGGMISTTVAAMEEAQFSLVIQKPVLPRELHTAIVNALGARYV